MLKNESSDTNESLVTELASQLQAVSRGTTAEIAGHRVERREDGSYRIGDYTTVAPQPRRRAGAPVLAAARYLERLSN